jgi:membrane protein involved in colicin uptake
LLFGGIGIASAFVSAWVGYKITDAMQKDVNVGIEEVQTRGNEAEAEAERAKAEVAKANEAIATATERAAELEKEAAEARAEQERLKAQLAWRTLSPNVLDRLVAGLVGGSGSVAIG